MPPFSLTGLTVKARLVVSIVAIIIPLGVLAIGSLFYFHDAFSSLNRLIADPLQEINVVARIQVNLLSTADELRGVRSSPTNDAHKEISRIVTQVDRAYQDALDIDLLVPAQQQAIIDSREEWLRALDVVRETSRQQRKGAVWSDSQRAKFGAHIAQAVALLDQASRSATGEVQELLDAAQTARRSFITTIVVLIFISLTVAIVGGLMLARSIFIPLKALEQGASRFGSGDLGHRIASEGRDEFTRLAETFNAMAARIQSSHRTLSELSVRDSLTGLYNNGEFHRLLEAEIARSLRYQHVFAALMLDVDYFKRINDSLGHLAGDAALRQLAATLTSVLRPVDCVARYGSEEFAIILPETPLSGGLQVAERLRRTIYETPVKLGADEKAINVSVSIGIAAFPDHSRSGRELVAFADRALYEAKHAGRNRVCVATVTQ